MLHSNLPKLALQVKFVRKMILSYVHSPTREITVSQVERHPSARWPTRAAPYIRSQADVSSSCIELLIKCPYRLVDYEQRVREIEK